MVGDSLTDVEAAWTAGVRDNYMIQPSAPHGVRDRRYTPVESLLDAAILIVSRQHQHPQYRR